MKIRHSFARRWRRAGFTLIESMIAISIFAVVGYGLFVAVDIAFDSGEIVTDVTGTNRNLRKATRSLHDEMGQASDGTITIGNSLQGSHELTFMVPILVGGAESWGVYDRTLGSSEDDWNKENWQVRYTVQQSVVEEQLQLNLVRQVIDAAGAVQSEKTVVEHLAHGENEPAGFHVEKVGDMWVVTCTAYGSATSKQASSTTFHIRTRN